MDGIKDGYKRQTDFLCLIKKEIHDRGGVAIIAYTRIYGIWFAFGVFFSLSPGLSG